MKRVMTYLLCMIGGAIAGIVVTRYLFEKKLVEKQKLVNKHLELFLLMNQWLAVKQEGKSICDYLEIAGYKNIAIYGMSYVGKTLYQEMRASSIQVKYAIDKNVTNVSSECDVVSPEDCLEEVDAVIVTAVSYYSEIREMLEQKMSCPIISLEDILFEI